MPHHYLSSLLGKICFLSKAHTLKVQYLKTSGFSSCCYRERKAKSKSLKGGDLSARLVSITAAFTQCENSLKVLTEWAFAEPSMWSEVCAVIKQHWGKKVWKEASCASQEEQGGRHLVHYDHILVSFFSQLRMSDWLFISQEYTEICYNI